MALHPNLSSQPSEAVKTFYRFEISSNIISGNPLFMNVTDRIGFAFKLLHKFSKFLNEATLKINFLLEGIALIRVVLSRRRLLSVAHKFFLFPCRFHLHARHRRREHSKARLKRPMAFQYHLQRSILSSRRSSSIKA